MSHTISQNKAIRKHLEAGKTITHFEAENRFGCARLAARIKDLRDRGLNIKTTMIRSATSGKRFAEYQLEVQL